MSNRPPYPSMSRQARFPEDSENYVKYCRRACARRNASRELGIGAELRQLRRESMRFWARLAVNHCGGVRGSYFNLVAP